jgi:hypothetical protein
MPKPPGHLGCRTRELLFALSVEDLRRALEEASGDELAPVLTAMGVQTRSAGRKVPQLLRARMRTLGHDACHDVACFLTQAPTRFLDRLLPDEEGPVDEHLLAGPVDEFRRTWPLGLVRLTFEAMWFAGDLDQDQRDRLLAAVDARVGTPAAAPAATEPDGPPTGPAPAAAPSAPAPAPAPVREVPLDAPGTPLDATLSDAVARARTGPAVAGNLAALRLALEEVVALDPSRPCAWYQYGLVVAALRAEADQSVVQPLPGPARLAFVLGLLRGLADLDARDALVAVVRRERAAVEEVLARREGAAVAVAIVLAHLDQAKVASRLLALVAVPPAGWQRLVGGIRDHLESVPPDAPAVEAELVLRALADALWRWAATAEGRGQGLEEPATSLLLQRIGFRRRRGDFVGAGRLLASVDDAYLTAETHAAAACERALVGADVAGLDTLRCPRGETEWARLVDRLQPVRRHLVDAVDADPGGLVPTLLLGMLLYGEGDTSAAATLAVAAARLRDRPGATALAREVAFHAGLARLRLLEPGTDEAAYGELAAAMAEGYAPVPDDLASAVVALEAHGSPHAGELLASAVAVAPTAPALVSLVVQRARTGDDAACAMAEGVASDRQLPMSLRFELLDAALEGAGHRCDPDSAERLVGAIDDVLVRAGDSALDERFAAALADNEVLRLAIDPAAADALRLEVLRRIGRIDEARAIATALFYRAAGGGLRAFDPADLFDVLIELGLDRAELDDLARLLPSPPDGKEPAARVHAPVHVLFVGGNETQDRYREAVDASLALRYDGKVRITWFLSGWRSNWHTDAARVEAAYEQGDVVVLMTFVRTHLGQRVRRSAGEHGLPWVACTGHGREAIERAIDRAVAIASDRMAATG